MKQSLLNRFWLRVGMIAAVMTTALAGSAWAQDVNDVLTQNWTGVTGTSYTEWSGKSATSSAVYAGQSAGGNGSIQLRSNNNNSGIVTTTSGGNVRKIVVQWNASTVGGRTLNVYGKNSAYSAATDLYNSSEQGTLLGTIVNGTSTELTITGDYEYFGLRSNSGAMYLEKITITWETGSSSDVATSVVINSSNITNTNVYDGTAAGTLTASVVAGEATLSDADITWSGDNDAVATIDATTGVVTLVGAGNVTFKATYAGEEGKYKASFATYEMTVTNSDPNAPGTANKPYTVAEARAAIDAGTGVTGVYAKGIVSKIVTAYNSQYGNISYNISADGTEEADQLQAYRGKSYNGEDFTSADDIQVGDVVVIYGNLKKYNNTYEFEQDNQLVSLQRPVVTTPGIDVAETEVTVPAEGKEGTIAVDYLNISNVAAEVFFCDADGNAATYDWIVAEINSQNNNVDYIIDANTSSDVRTAYFKVYALDDDANDVYSELITINQAGYVAPAAEFATLPFAFDGGRADIEAEDGLTQDGLDSDYNSSPKLKFNSTGDYVVLAFNERPGVLTFDIKGNSFSGGTFTVQTSEDGVTYTDLESYTTLSATQSEKFENLGENVRYIKWIYTEKSSGNVALGNIALAKYTEPVLVAAITVDPAEVSAPAEGQEGTITVTYENMDETNITSRQIVWYTDPTDEATMSPNSEDWIVADFDTDQNVSYIIEENTATEARTAYFKVWAKDGDGNEVYSDLVTVTQAGYVEPATPGNWVETALTDIVAGDVFVIVCNNGNTYAMSNDNGTSKAPAAVAVTVADKTLSGDVPANIQWQFTVGEEGYTFYPNGDDENWLYCTNTNNGVRVGTNDNKVFTVSEEDYLYNTATSRFVGIYNSQDWRCYTNTTGNIAGQTFKFYKKVESTEETVTVGEAGYATYVTKSAVAFPSTVTAYIGAVKGSYVSLTEVAAVPAGTAVVLKGAGTHTLTAATTVADVTDNELKASDGTVEGDGTIFILAKPAGEEVGFYPAQEGTKVAAGKAYIVVPNAGSVKGFTFIFDDDATGINEEFRMKNEESSIYNLAGQRLQKMQKGINIVGGRKIAIK